ncbi:MAG: hypothetical protein Q8O29_05425 [Polaromonas sp.]|uniref:hypothetical protein n=1 Tax=Polaromonas sp. TaxID=1869339 RepID=UPI002734E003|nr:hypothetical protein [Polaromonas sp.]MDP2817711.1 hypothetical protein [Polaromonas sp.]
MTLAASSRTGVGAAQHEAEPGHFVALWLSVAAAFAMLIAFLTLTPDGVAEPVQTLAGWLVGGGVAALAVIAVVTGLARLLDCEDD